MAAVAAYGGAALAVILAINCLGVPFPTSLVMLAAGALSADGDLAYWDTGLLATAGAVLGDQTGYWLGRLGGGPMVARLAGRLNATAAIAKAEVFARRWGGIGVFLTRWLLSPLGPYVNLVAGAAGVGWPVFLVWSTLGEGLWVFLYTGLGFAFADRIEAVADILGNAAWFLVALAATVGLGVKLFGRTRRDAAG